MGLDAFVYCDCFEAGRLRGSPPEGSHPALDDDGSVLCGSNNLDIQIAFDGWRFSCEHPDGLLLHHRIGNIALVAALRNELQRFGNRFPRLLTWVLYNGTHCGDSIKLADMQDLRTEVAALAQFPSLDTEMEESLRRFETQMAELIDCALRVGKPIAF